MRAIDHSGSRVLTSAARLEDRIVKGINRFGSLLSNATTKLDIRARETIYKQKLKPIGKK